MMKRFLLLAFLVFNIGASCLAKLSFVGVVPSEYARELIVLVKEISLNGRKYLVVFDRKVSGQLFDIENSYEPCMNLGDSGNDEFPMTDMFYFVDQNKQRLLISYHDCNLYVYNLDEPIYLGKTYNNKLPLGYKFSLSQQEDGLLVVEKEKDETSYVILNLSWSMIKERLASHNHDNIVFKHGEISADASILEQGLVVGPRKIQEDTSLRLKDSFFDLSSIPEDQKSFARNYDGTKSLPAWFSYHKTCDGLVYCGHSGQVSVWREDGVC